VWYKEWNYGTFAEGATYIRLGGPHSSLGLGFGLVIVNLFCLVFCFFFCFRLDNFVLVLFAFVLLGLVSSMLCQEIGREERLRNDLFYVEWDVKPERSQSTNLSFSR